VTLVPPLQLMPTPPVPGWPVLPVGTPGAAGEGLWGSVAKTTPAEETSRQAPMVSETIRCFICALPFKAMLRIGKIAQRVPTDSSSIFIDRPLVGRSCR
jgi:hypothetical protein